MNIWIVQIGEPTPTETHKNERIMRSGLLSTYLAQRGHYVTWWSTTFDHARKQYRYHDATVYHWKERIVINHLHSKTPYRKNISWARIKNHNEIVESFKSRIADLELPDLILSGMPTPELCVEVARFGKKHKIPTILDVRDLWPDDMVRLIPSPLQWLAKWMLSGIKRDVVEACETVTGICGTSSIFVDWGLNHAKRTRSNYDADFPLGYSDESPTLGERIKAEEFWNHKGICKNDHYFKICFFGALGTTCQLKSVMDAVRQIQKIGRKIKLIICGKGDRFEEYRMYSKNDKHIIMTGLVGKPEIWQLMRICDIGLVPVSNIYSYMSNYPNKTIEYMSSGLPVVSSLRGIYGELVEREGIGLIYQEQNTDDIVAKILRMMDCPLERCEMSKKARRLYERKFNADKVYTDFASHLEKVVRAFNPI